jgi:hypothetical protein
MEAPCPGLVSEIIVDREKAVISGPREAVAAAVSVPDRLGGFSVLYVNEWRTGKDETANWRAIVQRLAYKGETIGCNEVSGCFPRIWDYPSARLFLSATRAATSHDDHRQIRLRGATHGFHSRVRLCFENANGLKKRARSRRGFSSIPHSR